MKAREINKAARAYAQAKLGEDQFRRNKMAVRAICDDYKVGYDAGFQSGKAASSPIGLQKPGTGHD